MNWWRNEQTRRRLLIGLIVVASVLRLCVCFQHNPLDYLFSDPHRHWENGKNLFLPGFIGAGDPILYQVYVYLLRLFTGDNRYLVALACGILSVVMPWTFYRAAREFGLARNASLSVWTLIAWAPSLFTIYHYIMMETLLLPLVGLGFWFTGRQIRKGGLRPFLAMVFVWMLACLTKMTVVPLAVICVGYVWWRGSGRGLNLAMGLGLVAVLLVPNAIRTQKYLGFVAPFGNPWLTKIQHRSGARTSVIKFPNGGAEFGSPSSYVDPLEPLSNWSIRRAWTNSVVSIQVDPAHGQVDWLRAYEAQKVSWQEWWYQLGENVIVFLFAPSWPDSNDREWDGCLAYVTRWLWAVLIFYLLDCNIREFWCRRFNLLPIAVTVFALILIFQNMATTEGRYRKPLEPLLLLNVVWVAAMPSRKTSAIH